MILIDTNRTPALHARRPVENPGEFREARRLSRIPGLAHGIKTKAPA